MVLLEDSTRARSDGGEEVAAGYAGGGIPMSRHLTREERRDIRAIAAKMLAVGTEPVFVVNDRTVLAVLQGNRPPADPAEKSAEIERMVNRKWYDSPIYPALDSIVGVMP